MSTRRHDDHRLQRAGRRLRPHLQFTRQADGTTVLDAVAVREGKSLKGRVLGLVPGTVGKGALRKAPANTVKAIEARYEDPRSAALGSPSVA